MPSLPVHAVGFVQKKLAKMSGGTEVHNDSVL